MASHASANVMTFPASGTRLDATKGGVGEEAAGRVAALVADRVTTRERAR